MKTVCVLAASLVLALSPGAAQSPHKPGILLLAHGGSPAWNAHVDALAAKVDGSAPVEVALGMATRAAIQGAVDRLAARGVTRISAVPLFVSSHSSVITSTEYLLGARKDAPAALAIFARMNHGGSGGGHADHAAPGAAADPTSPVTSPVPIRMIAGARRSHPSSATSSSRAPGTSAGIPRRRA